MAIENAKLLNVRIKNKYDSYDNWASSGLVLEAGEIAIAYTTVDVKIDNGTAKHPALLMKVGDGVKTFANLPWLSAKAADVLSVCKNEVDLKEFINSVIADAGIASDDAMEALAGRVTTAEGAIDALEALVGTTAVQTQISNAIAALNLADTYAAKEHVHVKADIEDFAHSHEMAEVNGLVDALAGKEAVGEGARVEGLLNNYIGTNDARVKAVEDDLAGYKTSNDAAVKANADAIDGILDGESLNSFSDVEKTFTNYQEAGDYSVEGHKHVMADITDLADALALKAEKSDLEALAGKVGSVAEGSTVVGMIEAVDGKADDNAGAIEVLEGKVATLEANGYDDTEVRGLITTNANVIDTIKADYLKAADKTELQNNIDTLTGVVETLSEGIDADKVDGVKDLIKYVEDHGAEVTGMKDDIAANKKAIEDHVATDHDFATADATLKAELEGKINGKVAQGDFDAVEGRVDTLEGEMDTVEGKVSTLESKMTAVEGKVSTLESEMDAVEAAVATKAEAQALADAVAALEGVDDGLERRIATLEGKFEGDASVATLIATAKQEAINAAATDATTKADAAESAAKAYADNLDTAMNVRVEALEAIDHEHANKDVLDGISAEKVAAWDGAEAAAKQYVDDMKISETYATQEELNTAKTDLTTEINKKANDEDLAPIAKSGSTDDLIQGLMTIVLDCGGASEEVSSASYSLRAKTPSVSSGSDGVFESDGSGSNVTSVEINGQTVDPSYYTIQ